MTFLWTYSVMNSLWLLEQIERTDEKDRRREAVRTLYELT